MKSQINEEAWSVRILTKFLSSHALQSKAHLRLSCCKLLLFKSFRKHSLRLLPRPSPHSSRPEKQIYSNFTCARGAEREVFFVSESNPLENYIKTRALGAAAAVVMWGGGEGKVEGNRDTQTHQLKWVWCC